ncbi:MAG TPA: ECF transporter S component [Acetivibrio sp.]|nr:ECF transporter S component [Acetivibrio sp.]HPT90579.1 ECF transporter S component [Acetivibrio sp.]
MVSPEKTSKNSTTKLLALNGMMIALVFVVTYFTKVPTIVGYLNLGDAVIIITAVILGKKSGFLAGAVGSAIADMAASFYYFAPITFFVKGLEGLVVGLIIETFSKRTGSKRPLVIFLASVAGSVVMVLGYFISELYIMKIFDDTMGLAAALKDLPFNLVQGGFCTVVGYSLSLALERFKVLRFLSR